MAYNKFDEAKPDPTTDNGAAMCNNTRYNLTALRDMVLMGGVEGWNMTTDPANETYPNKYIYTNPGVERIELEMSWDGTEEGRVNSVTYKYYPAETGGTADTIGTNTFTYNADGAVTTSTWS
jgi:hypothetical protein